jgi:molybdopterin synthase sulfur carrier subunit
MPTVFIPSMMQKLTAGAQQIVVEGSSVRQVIRNLDKIHPGVKDWLVDDNQLKSNISIAIDGIVTPMGLLEEVEDASEIHFVAAISGGACSSLARITT